jgi:hypothetical protein
MKYLFVTILCTLEGANKYVLLITNCPVCNTASLYQNHIMMI